MLGAQLLAYLYLRRHSLGVGCTGLTNGIINPRPLQIETPT